MAWDGLDLSQQRGILGSNLGERGHIKVPRAKYPNKGLDTSTINIRWFLGNEAAMPDRED